MHSCQTSNLSPQAGGQSALEQAEAAAQAVAEAEEAAALATRLMDVANRYEEEAQLAGGTPVIHLPLPTIMVLRSGRQREVALLSDAGVYGHSCCCSQLSPDATPCCQLLCSCLGKIPLPWRQPSPVLQTFLLQRSMCAPSSRLLNIVLTNHLVGCAGV